MVTEEQPCIQSERSRSVQGRDERRRERREGRRGVKGCEGV